MVKEIVNNNAEDEPQNNDYKNQIKELEFNDDEVSKLKTRLKDYILHASSRVDFYDSHRKFFLQLNVSLLVFTVTVIPIIIEFLVGFFYLIIGLSFLSFGSILNLFLYTMEMKTDIGDSEFMKTLWFFRNNVPKKHKVETNGLESSLKVLFNEVKKKSKSEFLKDDIKQLFILFRYQARRFKLAQRNVFVTCAEFTFFIAFGISQILSFIFTPIISMLIAGVLFVIAVGFLMKWAFIYFPD